MNNDGIFANVHFLDFNPDRVEITRRGEQEYVTFSMGLGSNVTLSGKFGLARQLIKKLEQEIKRADNALIAKYCKEKEA